MPGPVSESNPGPSDESPYVPSWCYEQGPRIFDPDHKIDVSQVCEDKNKEFGWAIWNPKIGFYFSSFTDTRQCAIRDHEKNTRKKWAACRRYGDKAVKAKLEICFWKKRS